MKTKDLSKRETDTKKRSRGGDQALSLGPRGVSADESPTINAAREKAPSSKR